jgi:hypothetical protein
LAASVRRDKLLRVAAIGLVVYGLFGFGLLALAYVVTAQTFAQLAALSRSVEEQRSALGGSLKATSETLAATSTTFDDFATTLAQARQSSLQASQFARELGGTMSEMGSASNVQIFGFQPLAGLGGGFGRASQQLDALAGNLEQTSQALGRNVEDVGTIKTSVGQARGQIDALARAFDATVLPGTQPELMRPFQLAIYGLLVWLGGQAVLGIVLGVMLFHYSHRRVRAHRAERRAAARAAQEIIAHR